MRAPILATWLLLALTADAAAQSGRVTGTVRDDRGDPIRGATIIAENLDASPSSFTASTDDRGRFAIIGLRSGLWSFRSGAPGYSSDGGEVNVRTLPGVTPPLTFRLQKLAIIPSALGSLAPKDLQASLAAADIFYNNRQWDQAIAAYKEILERSPSLTVINLQIAAAHRNKREFDDAITAYGELLKSDPDNDKAKVGIAMTGVEKGDLEMAERTLEAAAESPAASREVLFDLGEVKQARSQTAAAVKAYERAAAIDPTWGKPPFALGRMAAKGGDTTTARRYFQTVIDIDPVSPEAAEATTLLRQLEPSR